MHGNTHGNTLAVTPWLPDRFLPGFESLELEFPDDYDGRVLATLVRLPHGGEAPRGAVLFVHGFIDYFFQRHLAERFAMEGYAFYALDLRKHGRSLRPHQHPNFCKSVAEFYAEITRAIDVIGEPVLLAGHSTGGYRARRSGASATSAGCATLRWAWAMRRLRYPWSPRCGPGRIIPPR